MRLIDADESKKNIVETAILINHPPSKAEELYKLIDSQPTAFDVEKVIEQLKEESRQSYADFEKYAEEHNMGSGFNDWHYKGLNRAIEIVKRGGRDD